MKKHAKHLSPIHPGQILLEEFLVPMELSQYRLAKDIDVPPRRINEIVLGKRGISADTALRLAEYFDMSPEFWANLQVRYDMDITRIKVGKKLSAIKPCPWLAKHKIQLQGS